MKKKCFLVVLLGCALYLGLNAKVIPFRSGELLNAEFSTTKPNIKNFDKLLFGKDDAKTYAVVYLRLSPSRTISIFDYTLEVNNKLYNCVAIQRNYDGFEYSTDTFNAKNSQEIFSLLFFVDESMSNKTYDLKAMFQPIDISVTRVPFKSINSGSFTESTMIKRDGNF